MLYLPRPLRQNTKVFCYLSPTQRVDVCLTCCIDYYLWAWRESVICQRAPLAQMFETLRRLMADAPTLDDIELVGSQAIVFGIMPGVTPHMGFVDNLPAPPHQPMMSA